MPDRDESASKTAKWDDGGPRSRFVEPANCPFPPPYGSVEPNSIAGADEPIILVTNPGNGTA
jgi:hypothetical protein